MRRNDKDDGGVAGDMAPPSPGKRGRPHPLLSGAVLAGLLAVYAGCYYQARASHRLVLHSSICSGDEVRPGAGEKAVWSVLFAPAILAENAYREVRDRW